MKVNYRFRMDADELQAGPIALEELCKQPKKDSSDFLVLEHTVMHTYLANKTTGQMC